MLLPRLIFFVLTASPGWAQRAEDKPLPPAEPVAVEMNFEFGAARPGTVAFAVADYDAYSTERGFGYDFGTKPGGDSPFFFSVKVPEGNYRVTVTLGDHRGESDTTIRSESGQLHAVGVRTEPGQFVTRTIYANVRRPELAPAPPATAPGETRVHMFIPGEGAMRHWDEKLTLEFNGPRPRVTALRLVKDDRVPVIFMAGDSTVADPRAGPGGNWPTQLAQFLKPEVVICNSASSGETSKSFITGQRFDKVLSQMKAGDFLLVQFGHNDSKPQWPQSYTEPATSFKAYLAVYLAETKRRGATLVLVTPMERRSNGDTVGPWARAMREFAQENKVPLIDQWAMSKETWAALGPKVNDAFADPTHLNGYGGYLLAKNMVRGIKAGVPALAKFIVDGYRDMDPAKPEPPPEYLRQAPGPP
jgi:lysophospholipase L1-like esterase